jgi:hypothetical protein
MVIPFVSKLSTSGTGDAERTEILAYQAGVGAATARRHVQQILSTALASEDLRDEVYCQLIKQSTKCPSEYVTVICLF